MFVYVCHTHTSRLLFLFYFLLRVCSLVVCSYALQFYTLLPATASSWTFSIPPSLKWFFSFIIVVLHIIFFKSYLELLMKNLIIN